MKRLLTTIMVLSCAASTQVWTQTRCDIHASINNQDSSETTDAGGTNVRKGPGKNFEVVKTLTSPTGFIFHIIGSDGAWVHVNTYGTLDGTGKEYKIDGWIYAQSLFLKFDHDADDKSKEYGKLFSEPSASSKPVLSKAQMEKKENQIVSLITCQGTWAKVLWEGTAGWLSRGDQCSDMWDICGEQ
ncbi:MAG: SH3 domain-containing protein [Pyrinomonadaceae bacterium]